MSIPSRGTRPAGFGEASAGREMIRIAQEQKKASVLLGQWEMIITFFKHSLEIPLCIEPENQDLRQHHRFILTSAMSIGEMLLTETKAFDEAAKSFISANVRYLRDTYRQWYFERDSQSVEKDYQIICNAGESPSPAGAGA